MKNLLLMASALFLVSQANAQDINFDELDDLTPYKYQFDTFNDGDLYPVDGIGEGEDWWPSKNWPTLTPDGAFEGFLGISCDKGSTHVPAAYAAGTSIVDMGGDVGNVLCIKGSGCPDEFLPGVPKCDVSVVTDPRPDKWNCSALKYTFCTSNNPNDPKPNVFKLVMKAIHPVGVGEPGWGISSGTHFRVYEHTTGALELGTGNGNAGTNITIADCGTAEDEWMELIYKYNHGTKPAADGSTNAPTQSLILELSPGTLNGMAFVIKEVSFYHDPTFTAEKWEESKRIIKIAGGSGFHNAMDNSKISYTLNDGKITLANIKAGAKIKVYSLSGMLMKQIKSEDTTATFSLDKGYYTINVDGQNIKVLN